MMIERRRAEVRAASGRRLVGAPMRYGSEARVRHPSGAEVSERIAPFAFHAHLASGAETRLNLMHDKSIVIASTKPGDRGRLELRDAPDKLSMVAILPVGDAYDQVLALVEDKSTAELSVEMRVKDEALIGDRRTVRRADLPAIGIVDRGAYPQPVEVRRDGRGVRGRIDYRKDRVISNRGRVRKQRFEPGAFSYNMDRWNSLQLEMNAAIEKGIEQGVRDAIQDRVDLSPDITLLAGVKYDDAIASMKAASATFKDTPEALEFDAPDITGTEAGRQLLARIESGQLRMGVTPIFALPPEDAVDGPVVTLEAEPDNPEVFVEVIHAALLTAVAITNRAPLGNPGLIEVRHDLVEQDEPPSSSAQDADVALVLTLDRAREILGDADNSLGDFFPDAFEAANAAIEQYCPVAPDVIHTQAILLMVGYWISMPHDNSAMMRELDGDRDIWQDTKRSYSALSFSGSKSLLSPFKRRRALG